SHARMTLRAAPGRYAAQRTPGPARRGGQVSGGLLDRHDFPPVVRLFLCYGVVRAGKGGPLPGPVTRPESYRRRSKTPQSTGLATAAPPATATTQSSRTSAQSRGVTLPGPSTSAAGRASATPGPAP